MYDLIFKGKPMWTGLTKERLNERLLRLIDSLDDYQKEEFYREVGFEPVGSDYYEDYNPETDDFIPKNIAEFLDVYEWTLPTELKIGYTEVKIAKHLLF